MKFCTLLHGIKCFNRNFGQKLVKRLKKRVFLGKFSSERVKYGEERSVVCDCTHEEKIDFEGFTHNGCYGNQPQPFEIFIFQSVDANTSCSFTKQDFTLKQAYRISLCFVLCNEPRF